MRRSNGYSSFVLALFDKYPAWSSGQLAERLGLLRRSGGGYVRAVLRRHGRQLLPWRGGCRL